MEKSVIVTCPACKSRLETITPCEPVRCMVCGAVFTAMEKPRDEHAEAEDIFLSGSSFLALGEYERAAECFLNAAKLSPTEPKNWLYLLCAMTVRFTVLHPIADEKAAFVIGKRRIIYKSVYKNFISTAKKDDFIYAKSEFDIDLSADGFELWDRIIREILSPTFPHPIKKAVALAHFATARLEISHPQIAKRYYPALYKRLNPISDGVLEINTLRFCPEAPDGVLKIETEADSIEFSADKVEGAESFGAFMLTRGVESIGSHFPFPELIVDKDVTAIPGKLISFCQGLKKVTLSPSVKSIGADAFIGCASLRSVSPLDNIESIGSRAFFDTAIRTLDLPSGLKKLGKEILGAKKPNDSEISKYLIELDAELAERSEGFNLVGQHKCGYVARENEKYKLVYPEKTVDGSKIPLTHDEKMIFKALACVSIDTIQEKATQKGGKIGDKIRGVIGKLKKKS